ncbi:hypothetical protein MTR67_004002 [Solanum verrucosum]|uniref:Transposase-associated domain-containing protein n=1 Tax=Solanum verrucosum TaxID=315347 RepID=A0AAF0PTJ9_SOLVR|nr:hypothetical protein MTR67_004002 [Solanum verrucosum]
MREWPGLVKENVLRLVSDIECLLMKETTARRWKKMDRSWMYERTNFGRVGMKPEFVEGVDGFVDYAMTLEPFQHSSLVKCPCKKCQCMNYEKPKTVKLCCADSSFLKANPSRRDTGAGAGAGKAVKPNVQNYRMHYMVQDAYRLHSDFEFRDHVEEAPNDESRIFFEQLKVASRPLYEGSPHWETDARFKQINEVGKKVRATTKGGSLHTIGVQSQGNVKRKLEKELGRPVTQAKAFKTAHTRKKKNPGDPDVWVPQLTYNQYMQSIEDYRQIQLDDSQGMPLSQEQTERMWLDSVGGPSWYGYSYDMPQRPFREFYSELKGLGWIPLYPSDVVCAPRLSQSRPIQHQVYGQYRGLTDEPSSDKVHSPDFLEVLGFSPSIPFSPLLGLAFIPGNTNENARPGAS